MSQILLYILIGLGSGAAAAGLGTGLVVLYKGTGVVNFASAAIAMWSAYVYDEATRSGDLVLPIGRIALGGPLSAPVAALLGVASAALIGVLCHMLVLRWMRSAPPLAKVVATVGLLLIIQALVTLHFDTGVRSVKSLLPEHPIHVGGGGVGLNALLAAAIALALAGAARAWFKYARTGLAARAAAESEMGAQAIGLSPQRLSLITWAASSAIAGLFGILVAPITSLSAATFPLLVVPALAAALLGRFDQVLVTAAAGLVIGAAQSLLTYLEAQGWLPSFAHTGLPESLPLIVIIGALFLLGRGLPDRGAPPSEQQLPPAPAPRRPGVATLAIIAMSAVALVAFSGENRLALDVTLCMTLLAMSLVLLTGYLGQISLAQMAFAGTAAFLLSKMADGWHIGFPWSPLLAITAASAVGIIAGLPALRIRGTQLAVVTLAMTLCAQQLIFNNPALLNSEQLAPVPPPGALGINLNPLGADYPEVHFGLFVVAALAACAYLIAKVRNGDTGRRFLAVRSNERAAAAAGVNVTATKLTGFAVSAVIAAVGGVMLAYLRGEITADGFDAFTGLSVLAVAYLGGITTLGGAILAGLLVNGGLIYTLISQNLNLGKYYLLITGLGLVVTAVLNPQGIALRTVMGVRDAARLLPRPSLIGTGRART